MVGPRGHGCTPPLRVMVQAAGCRVSLKHTIRINQR
jgi:hypothetical protein